MNKLQTFFLRVSLQEKILFAKNLSLTLKSGISLVNSLKLIRNQTSSRSMRKIADSLIEDTNKGVFLSAGLMKFRNVFGELFINIIKVAETSGTLAENLVYIGDELKKKYELRKKVKGALVYPIIILIATVTIAASMVVFVFPKLLPLFENLKTELPLATRLLIKISDVLSNHGILIIFLLIGIFILFRLLLKLKPLRLYYHIFLLNVPFVSRSVVNFNAANFSRTLALLLKSGVRIIEAINITAETMTNLAYQKSLRQAAEQVRKGEYLSKHLYAEKRKFPTILVNLIEVGENTGNLTENLFYLSEYYENEVDDFVKNLASILEPVLLLIMGVIVGFIALSFITPIYQITRSIK